ncbi:MAG TPA: ABC transporter permease [Bryobacteraceae bacterium]|nr:ABC transporter permease [Bryobacteraceae bacterium]
MTQTTEEVRASWIARWAGDALQDLRYTLRTLRHEAGFTTFAILIAGLGIGASSTIFSVVNALLLRPLPFRDPGRLVWIANDGKDGDLSGQTVQVGHFLDLREHNRSFSDMAAYFAFYGVGDSKLTGTGEPERLSGVPVSQNFFPLLGIQPQVGRLFSAEECRWNGPRAVLLSHRLWQRRFASDPRIVGRKLTLDDAPVTVVGVLPASFDFAAVFAPGSHFDLYFPFPLTPETNRWGNTLAIVGRLKPGVTVARAQAEFGALGAEIARQHPERNELRPRLSPLEAHVSGRLRPALLVLAGAVGVVMLIVCANLSNLQLARTAARQKEMAVRVALGAGRRRLVRQMLTESVVLSCGGAVLGLVLAFAGTRVLAHLEYVSIPLLDSVRVDAGALAFTLLITIVSGVLFGLAPALQVPAAAVHDVLKDSNRGSSQGRGHAWIRGALVVSEIAFACMLLVGAGLLIRSFLRVLDVQLGFQPERAAALRIDPSSRYSDQAKRNAYFDEALRRVKEIPGIEAAGLTDVLPLGGNRSWGVAAKGQVYPPGQYPEAFVRIVSDGYLRAMGIPLRAGRDFTEHDTPSSEKVIIVNETLARRLWPGQDPLGQMVTQDGGRRVVGVAGNVRHVTLEQDSGSEMYLPMRQTNDYSEVDLVVRTALPPDRLASAVRSALQPIEPSLAGNSFRTLQQLVDKAVSPRRLIVLLLAGFSAFALVLASLGIYGVISYSVNQRTKEIGIRMALGASARELQVRILGQTLRLAAIGIAVGAAASWVLARAISGLLFGVRPADPVTFATMLLVLTTVAGVAGYLPARRASRIEPMTALRAE